MAHAGYTLGDHHNDKLGESCRLILHFCRFIGLKVKTDIRPQEENTGIFFIICLKKKKKKLNY